MIEAVDVSTDDASRVRHVEDPGQSGDPVETLVSAAPAVSCKIAIKPDGESWAVWQDAASHEIRFAVRNPIAKVWGPETRLSDTGDICANPRVVHTATASAVAFEVSNGPLSSIKVSIISDVPEPIPLHFTVGQTSFAGAHDLDLRSDQGHLWVSWIESDSILAWTEYDAATGTWSPAAFEPLDGSSVKQVRAVVRDRIFGN